MRTMSYSQLMTWCESHTVEFEQQAECGDVLAGKLKAAWDQYDGADNALTETALRGAVMAYREAHPTVEMPVVPRAMERAHRQFAADEMSEE